MLSRVVAWAACHVYRLPCVIRQQSASQLGEQVCWQGAGHIWYGIGGGGGGGIGGGGAGGGGGGSGGGAQQFGPITIGSQGMQLAGGGGGGGTWGGGWGFGAGFGGGFGCGFGAGFGFGGTKKSRFYENVIAGIMI